MKLGPKNKKNIGFGKSHGALHLPNSCVAYLNAAILEVPQSLRWAAADHENLTTGMRLLACRI